MKLIMNNPEQEAARIQENTGIKIIAARVV